MCIWMWACRRKPARIIWRRLPVPRPRWSGGSHSRTAPGGRLGRGLLLHVEDIMRRGDSLPRVGPETPVAEGLLEMTRKGLGMTAVLDDGQRVVGIFTDGDLRRALDRRVDVHNAIMRD